MTNFVGILQEKCQKNQKDTPKYLDVEAELQSLVKKCVCKLEGWTTEGCGCNKKEARQNAAELMLRRVDVNWFTAPSDNVATKIKLFCSITRKEKPVYIEKGIENGLFVVEYTFDGSTGVGKGSNKEAAKEKASEEIANHFHIHTFYDHYVKRNERVQQQKNAIVMLVELCQARNLEFSFLDKEVECGSGRWWRTPQFVVSCLVDKLVTVSKPNKSKKNAKLEAAALMFDKLK